MAIDDKSFGDKVIEAVDTDKIKQIIDDVEGETKKIVYEYLEKELDTETKKEGVSKVKEAIEKFDPDIREWSKDSILKSYTVGYNETSKAIAGTTAITSGGKKIADSLTVEVLRNADELNDHKDAANALLSDTYLDFANGMNGLQKSAERQINEALKRQIRGEMIKGQLRGTAIRDIASEVEELIGNQGFSALIDRGGRNWSLQRYSEMLTRTHIIKSSNEAAINRAVDKGVDIVQFSSHADPCEVCADLEGQIYSISGESDEYPQLDITLPLHPNCKHSWIPRPDLEE